MKRSVTGIRLIPLLLTVMLLVCGLSTTALAENKFYFNKEYNTVYEGETLQLELIREGDCAQEGDLRFTTSNTGVATVDKSGLVTAKSKGQVTIKATLKVDGRVWTASLTVTSIRRVESIEVTGNNLKVYDAADPAVADVLDPTSPYGDLPVLLLQKDKAQTINASCKPTTASNRKWQLISEDDSIVRASGTTLTGRSAGECLVTVQSVENPDVYQQYRALVISPITRVRVESDVKTIYIGETIMLDAVITPDDATIPMVTWSSDRSDNAAVDANGVVTGVSKGSAVIKATAADGSGRYGTITITVRQQPEEITLKKSEYSLKTGNYITLTPTVLPSTTNDKSVVWSSSDTAVAKVNSSGRVTAVAPGTTIITCESKTHPHVYAQAIVSVYQPVTKVAFTDKNPYVAVGETIYLNWTVSPDNATDSSVTFSTNKENVVRVGQDGSVTGLKRGECYVYATAKDGSGKKATIKVQVTQAVEGVGIKYDERTVGVGAKVTNNAIFYPDDASITNMTWYAQDETIASVSGTGEKVTVTGRNWGETTIIGVTEDGSYVTTFKVKVGDENKPLKITNLYVENGNTIRIVTYNQSNLTITGFDFEIEVYDAWGNPLRCNSRNGSNRFEGRLNRTLEPGESAGKGQYTFGSEFSRPNGIGKVVMRIVSYETEDGNSHYVRTENREERTWKVIVLDGSDG